MATRIENDAFYTSAWLVDWCLERLPPSTTFFSVLEPSAGSGAFLERLNGKTTKVTGFDINPKHKDVLERDFLKVETSFLEREKIDAVIGNPPFGRSCSLVVDFLEKSAEISTVNLIAFVAPRNLLTTLQKIRLEKALRDFVVWGNEEIPKTYALEENFSVRTNVRTSWFVFVRKGSRESFDKCCFELSPPPLSRTQKRVTDYSHPDFKLVSGSSIRLISEYEALDFDFLIIKNILCSRTPEKLIIFTKDEIVEEMKTREKTSRRPFQASRRCIFVKVKEGEKKVVLERFKKSVLERDTEIYGAFDSRLSTSIDSIIAAYDRAILAASAS